MLDKEKLQGRYIVPALAQGLQVLSLFTRERTRLSAPEVAQMLGLSRTTVFRLLHTLVATGYLRKEDDERHYSPGPAMLGSGFSYLASLDFVEVAQPVLQKLRDDTGLSAHLAIRDGREIVYVARYAAKTTVRSSVTIGTRFPVHATIMGRMMLLDASDAELDAMYPEKKLPQFSEQTPATLGELRELLREDRKRGYAASQSFFERGVSSVAAPVRDAGGTIIGAVNVTSVDTYFDPDEMNGRIKDLVLGAAREITRWISHDARSDAARLMTV
jgi:DNA-binding IclR family transcriptional regulator